MSSNVAPAEQQMSHVMGSNGDDLSSVAFTPEICLLKDLSKPQEKLRIRIVKSYYLEHALLTGTTHFEVKKEGGEGVEEEEDERIFCQNVICFMETSQHYTVFIKNESSDYAYVVLNMTNAPLGDGDANPRVVVPPHDSFEVVGYMRPSQAPVSPEECCFEGDSYVWVNPFWTSEPTAYQEAELNPPIIINFDSQGRNHGRSSEFLSKPDRASCDFVNSMERRSKANRAELERSNKLLNIRFDVEFLELTPEEKASVEPRYKHHTAAETVKEEAMDDKAKRKLKKLRNKEAKRAKSALNIVTRKPKIHLSFFEDANEEGGEAPGVPVIETVAGSAERMLFQVRYNPKTYAQFIGRKEKKKKPSSEQQQQQQRHCEEEEGEEGEREGKRSRRGSNEGVRNNICVSLAFLEPLVESLGATLIEWNNEYCGPPSITCIPGFFTKKELSNDRDNVKRMGRVGYITDLPILEHCPPTEALFGDVKSDLVGALEHYKPRLTDLPSYITWAKEHLNKMTNKLSTEGLTSYTRESLLNVSRANKHFHLMYSKRYCEDKRDEDAGLLEATTDKDKTIYASRLLHRLKLCNLKPVTNVWEGIRYALAQRATKRGYEPAQAASLCFHAAAAQQLFDRADMGELLRLAVRDYVSSSPQPYYHKKESRFTKCKEHLGQFNLFVEARALANYMGIEILIVTSERHWRDGLLHFRPDFESAKDVVLVLGHAFNNVFCSVEEVDKLVDGYVTHAVGKGVPGYDAFKLDFKAGTDAYFGTRASSHNIPDAILREGYVTYKRINKVCAQTKTPGFEFVMYHEPQPDSSKLFCVCHHLHKTFSHKQPQEDLEKDHAFFLECTKKFPETYELSKRNHPRIWYSSPFMRCGHLPQHRKPNNNTNAIPRKGHDHLRQIASGHSARKALKNKEKKQRKEESKKKAVKEVPTTATKEKEEEKPLAPSLPEMPESFCTLPGGEEEREGASSPKGSNKDSVNNKTKDDDDDDDDDDKEEEEEEKGSDTDNSETSSSNLTEGEEKEKEKEEGTTSKGGSNNGGKKDNNNKKGEEEVKNISLTLLVQSAFVGTADKPSCAWCLRELFMSRDGLIFEAFFTVVCSGGLSCRRLCCRECAALLLKCNKKLKKGTHHGSCLSESCNGQERQVERFDLKTFESQYSNTTKRGRKAKKSKAKIPTSQFIKSTSRVDKAGADSTSTSSSTSTSTAPANNQDRSPSPPPNTNTSKAENEKDPGEESKEQNLVGGTTTQDKGKRREEQKEQEKGKRSASEPEQQGSSASNEERHTRKQRFNNFDEFLESGCLAYSIHEIHQDYPLLHESEGVLAAHSTVRNSHQRTTPQVVTKTNKRGTFTKYNGLEAFHSSTSQTPRSSNDEQNKHTHKQRYSNKN